MSWLGIFDSRDVDDCFVAKTCDTVCDMSNETNDKDTTQARYADILQGYGFSPAVSNMVAETIVLNPGSERQALESIGASPALTNASLEALGIATFD